VQHQHQRARIATAWWQVQQVMPRRTINLNGDAFGAGQRVNQHGRNRPARRAVVRRFPRIGGGGEKQQGKQQGQARQDGLRHGSGPGTLPRCAPSVCDEPQPRLIPAAGGP
jgi:hypothetical protein